MIGTALTSIQCGIFLPKVMTDSSILRDNWGFTWFLYGSIFLVDCLYLYLLYHGQALLRQTRSSTSITENS